MFDLNFISEPGIQNETSDASWSFLHKKSEPEVNGKSDSKQSKVSFVQQNNWGNYAFLLIILGFIAVISILNSRYTQVQPDLVVLNQVIGLIDECSYIKTLQLEEANFSTDQVKVTIRSKDFTALQSLSQGYRMENQIPYEMYRKGKYSYINLIFPWKGNGKDGDITILRSVADKTVYSNETSINHTEDILEFQGGSSDIISFLLQMAENKQIQKFNFSVFHQGAGKFNLKVQLNLI
tara:strand:- start:13 stop:723 length:711 start_codon:yes stop_codon:yes gene_type:complete